MKTRLILIAIMFIVINLIFYFGFDSSDESEKSGEIEEVNQISPNENIELKQQITNAPNPIP